jgi:hypothetical protein
LLAQRRKIPTECFRFYISQIVEVSLRFHVAACGVLLFCMIFKPPPRRGFTMSEAKVCWKANHGVEPARRAAVVADRRQGLENQANKKAASCFCFFCQQTNRASEVQRNR